MFPDEISDAAINGDKDAVAAWLAANPQSVNDLNAHGGSLLILCINASPQTNRDDQLELLRYLLSQGADPNLICGLSQFEGGMTALFDLSSGHDFPELQQLVDCLLRAGADPNLKVSSDEGSSGATPLAGAINYLLAADNGSWQLPVVVRLLRAGASLDDCDDGLTAEDMIADEERRWSELVDNNDHFQAAKTLIHGVRAAGSWKKYCRRRAPHREILALRSLAMRGYITPYQKRRTRGAEYKIAIAFVARLGDNGIVWNILSFWRDPDDVEEVSVPDNDGVRVVRVYD